MRRFFSFISGAVSGALVGTVAALLMAPASGKGLRDSARARWTGFLDELRQASAQRRIELDAQLEAFKRGEAP